MSIWCFVPLAIGVLFVLGIVWAIAFLTWLDRRVDREQGYDRSDEER